MHDFFLNFRFQLKRTVYKWWCVVYKPVYKLINNGNWPEEKNPDNKFPSPNDDNVVTNQAVSTDNTINESENNSSKSISTSINYASSDNTANQEEVDLSNVDSDTLDRANEIMERLAREAAADNAKKQAAIDEARMKADEEARLASILKSTQVDISAFIAEGRSNQDNGGMQ